MSKFDHNRSVVIITFSTKIYLIDQLLFGFVRKGRGAEWPRGRVVEQPNIRGAEGPTSTGAESLIPDTSDEYDAIKC